MPDTTDFELLGTLATRAQAGDTPACETLLEHLYSYVKRILASRLGSFADLDDLTQECLLGMHKSLPSYHPSRSIKPWVQAIIRYKVADHFRTLARRRESALTEDVVDPATHPANAAMPGGDGLADNMDIRAMVNELPAPLGRAVVLTKFDGLSCEEAARREAVSAAALRKRLSRAYRQLAVTIGRELDTESHGR